MNENIYRFCLWFAKHVATTKRIIVVSVVIMAIGLILEFSYPGWEVSAFSRSGSFLVAFAVLCVFVNHIVVQVLSVQKQYLNKYDIPRDLLRLDIANSPGGFLALNEKSGDIDSFIDETERKVKSGVAEVKHHHAQLYAVSNILTCTEVFAGITGTLVWGFGDLFFKIFRC